MSNEASFCTIIVNSLEKYGLGYKIPDPSGNYAQTSIRCCDIIGRMYDKALYIEAKYNKDLAAFNLNRIEDHQAKYLNDFGKITNAITFIILGVHAGHGDTRAYIFDWNSIKPLYEKGFSFHAKELGLLPYNEVHKSLFDFENIITKKEIIEIYGEDVYGASKV